MFDYVHVMAPVWKSEDSMRESLLCFYHMGPKLRSESAFTC